jgi:hypothetical protein
MVEPSWNPSVGEVPRQLPHTPANAHLLMLFERAFKHPMAADENGRAVKRAIMRAILTKGKIDMLPGHFRIITQHMALSGPSEKDLTFTNSQPFSAVRACNTDKENVQVIHRLRFLSKSFRESEVCAVEV